MLNSQDLFKAKKKPIPYAVTYYFKIYSNVSLPLLLRLPLLPFSAGPFIHFLLLVSTT